MVVGEDAEDLMINHSYHSELVEKWGQDVVKHPLFSLTLT